MKELDKSKGLKDTTERKYKELYDNYDSQIPTILSDIENEFRELWAQKNNKLKFIYRIVQNTSNM